MRNRWLALLTALPLMACAGGSIAKPVVASASATPDWRKMATPEDRERLRSWRAAWTDALERARKSDPAAITREGALFNPDLQLAGSLPPPGDYRCRVFKLGAKGTAMADFTAYPQFDCRIDREDDVSSIYKLGGAQRPVGILIGDGDYRSVFLGTMMMADERSPLAYGRDESRDLAGVVERIGDKRWRLVLPYPHFESLLDVIELVPAG